MPLRCCLLLATVAALSLGCEHRAATPVSMEEVRAEEGPEQESWRARFSVTEDGRPRMDIAAGYMAEYEQGDSTYMLLSGSLVDTLGGPVLVYLYDAEGDSSTTLTANRVFYYDTERRFEARGNVVVNTRAGKRLETEHLVWYEDERTVRTPGFVRITDPPDFVQGFSLVADEDLASYELEQITGTTTIEEDE